MRVYLLNIILSFALLYAFCGCATETDGGISPHELRQCAVLYPDSALQLLRDGGAVGFNGGYAEAEYTMLYALAADGCGAGIGNSVQVDAAVELLMRSSDEDLRLLAYYCRGRMLYSGGHNAKAMLAFMHAEQIAEDTDCAAYAAVVSMQIGLLFMDSFDYVKALDCFKMAQLYFRIAGADYQEHNALVNVARSLMELKNYSEAEHYLLDELQWGYEKGNERICQSSVENLLSLYGRIGYYSKSQWLLESEYFAMCDSSAVVLRTMAYLSAVEDNADDAAAYMRRAWEKSSTQSDTLMNLSQMYEIDKMTGEYSKALDILENLHYMHDAVMRGALRQPILSAQRDYYQSQAQLNAYMVGSAKRKAVAVVVFVTLLLAVSLLLLRSRVAAKKAEAEKYMELAEEMKRTLHERNREYEDVYLRLENRNARVVEMDSQIAALFKKQFELLDELSAAFYETHDIKKDKETIYKRVRQNIDALVKDEKAVERLEAIVNRYKGGIMTKLREELPQLSRQELRFMVFVYAGFSSKAISIFTQDSVGNVYTRKSRIKSTISHSDAADKELFINAMN